jgi:hypothetical protein
MLRMANKVMATSASNVVEKHELNSEVTRITFAFLSSPIDEAGALIGFGFQMNARGFRNNQGSGILHGFEDTAWQDNIGWRALYWPV